MPTPLSLRCRVGIRGGSPIAGLLGIVNPDRELTVWEATFQLEGNVRVAEGDALAITIPELGNIQFQGTVTTPRIPLEQPDVAGESTGFLASVPKFASGRGLVQRWPHFWPHSQRNLAVSSGGGEAC
jgi:hypothetical protein